ncbi:MAG TPA: alpha/beta hydrolase [Archangium sp.]|uniref:alpha/beta fold hydrolase n=1 Tax=Archangium sp. TaxID=1872627 RepID=UPI002E32B205|nr:alpha/beta hydrolase [Archangium sp.]HEX5749812.1 alpha/beta hydrolase [Archangium sp.]
MKHLGRTLPFQGPEGQFVPDSIAEVKYLRLGGIEQWVMIRGESVANPPLILLYGGPGLTEMGFFRHFNAPLEKSFTVVYWDQRGSGKSFDRKLPSSSMTVEQFLSDLEELVDQVCKRLGKKEVVLYGHSWGSALGVLYTARHPEKVAAYVGSGQVGDWAAGESSSYDYVLAEAQRLNHRKALKKLRAIGPPPHDARRLLIERTWAQRLGGELSARTFWTWGRVLLGGPEASVFDLPNLLRGFRFSLDTMWAEVSKLNLLKAAPVLQVPVFFFLGRRDHWVPNEASLAYFEALTAPSKRLVWFDESGHEPFVDEPARFNTLMAELVRPVAVSPRKQRAPDLLPV